MTITLLGVFINYIRIWYTVGTLRYFSKAYTDQSSWAESELFNRAAVFIPMYPLFLLCCIALLGIQTVWNCVSWYAQFSHLSCHMVSFNSNLCNA